MAYCVNCGVELDKSCNVCPLCQTEVYHPSFMPDKNAPTPFPTSRGETEAVSSRDFTILMTIIFLTTSIVCGILNYFVFSHTRWSYYVIGVCVMLWVFLIPVYFPKKTNFFISSLLDGVSIGIYMGGISALHPGDGWYFHIALPMVVLVTVLLENFQYFSVRRKTPLIIKAAVLLASIAVICVGLELLLDYHFKRDPALSWAAVVLACCVAIDVILVTIFVRKGLRAEVRRRMHF